MQGYEKGYLWSLPWPFFWYICALYSVFKALFIHLKYAGIALAGLAFYLELDFCVHRMQTEHDIIYKGLLSTGRVRLDLLIRLVRRFH